MSKLILLNLEQPTMRADFESNAPTGLSLSDVRSMEQFLIGLKTHTGQVVTPEKARRCSAVLACMRGISEDLSALPLQLMKRGPNGDEPAPDHNLFPLLNFAPNTAMTALELREHIIFDMMLMGNFYVMKNEDPESPGDIGSLWPLQAGYVTRLSGQLFWTFSDPLTLKSGGFTPDIVWRGTLMSGNGIDGTALTLLAREAIGLLLAAEEQGARLFSYGIQSDFTLSTEDTVDKESKDQLRAALMQRHSGSGNAFLPLILEGGLKAGRIGLTAQESQYIEARKFQIEDIARVFRYPEVLLGNSTSGKSSTYASAEQFFQSYTKHTLTPWAVRLEQTMHRDLLVGKDKQNYFFRHDFSSLLRGDTAARYASYATAIATRMMSPAYAARLENLPYDPTRPTDYTGGAAPVGSTPASEVKPTDESAMLPGRVANHIFLKEHQALIGKKQDADIFYTHFGGLVEDLTGADIDRVLSYLDMRRTTADRFSPESKGKAIDTLILLCKKDK